MPRPRAPKTDAPYPPGWEPFLAAINADLDDDTPRLVFADWLQENGDEPRAEFVRIQCELYRVHPNWENREVQKRVFTPRDHELHERQRQLRIANFDRWVGSFPAWTKTTTWAFRRGFAYYFVPTALQWLKEGARVRAQSAVEELTVTNPNPRTRGPWRELFASPGVVGVRSLSLPDINTEGVRALTASPVLDSLRALDVGKVGKWGIQADDVAALVTSARLTNLRQLGLYSNWLGKRVAPVLAASQHIHDLEELRLVCTALLADEFEPLIAARKVERLRVLDLQGNAIGDRGVRALVHSKLTGLEELNLRYNDLKAESARALATWPGLRSMRVLKLAGAHFGPEGVRTLLTSEFLTSTEELELPARDVRKRDKAEFDALPAYQRIRHVTFAS